MDFQSTQPDTKCIYIYKNIINTFVPSYYSYYTIMQKLISFDIGIKNMAFCIFDMSSSPPSIQKWDVLNLMDICDNVHPVCGCSLKEKKAKKGVPSSPKLCNKKAKYEKSGQYYCEKHALAMENCLLPNKEYSPPALRKMKKDELLALSEKYFIFRNKPAEGTIISFYRQNTDASSGEPTIPTTAKALLERILAFFETKCFRVLQSPKKKTANETDLISIGRNMSRLLDQMSDITDGTITHVILENQISTIANRMKTIQGMLAQYFIMRGRPDIVIEFVSSSNKLKDFVAEKNTTYKQHKKDGIIICSKFLENNEPWKQWVHVLETAKRDDLADSFLQGIWYLKRGNIINYAENLKINSV